MWNMCTSTYNPNQHVFFKERDPFKKNPIATSLSWIVSIQFEISSTNCQNRQATNMTLPPNKKASLFYRFRIMLPFASTDLSVFFTDRHLSTMLTHGVRVTYISQCGAHIFLSLWVVWSSNLEKLECDQLLKKYCATQKGMKVLSPAWHLAPSVERRNWIIRHPTTKCQWENNVTNQSNASALSLKLRALRRCHRREKAIRIQKSGPKEFQTLMENKNPQGSH